MAGTKLAGAQVDDLRHESYGRAAKARGLSRSDWMREVLDAAVVSEGIVSPADLVPMRPWGGKSAQSVVARAESSKSSDRRRRSVSGLSSESSMT